MRFLFCFPNTMQVLVHRVQQFLSSESSPKLVGPGMDMTDAERDLRTGDQWLLSVVQYLEFRSGKAWRKLNRADERWNAVRCHYLDGVRLLSSLRYLSVPACDCSRCVPRKKPVGSEDVTLSLREIKKAARA